MSPVVGGKRFGSLRLLPSRHGLLVSCTCVEAILRSLFDQVNLAEITSPDFPGERLTACFNPLLAETEENLTKLARDLALRTKAPLSAADIGVKAGRVVVGRHKMAKHIRLTINDYIFMCSHDKESIRSRSFIPR